MHSCFSFRILERHTKVDSVEQTPFCGQICAREAAIPRHVFPSKYHFLCPDLDSKLVQGKIDTETGEKLQTMVCSHSEAHVLLTKAFLFSLHFKLKVGIEMENIGDAQKLRQELALKRVLPRHHLLISRLF